MSIISAFQSFTSICKQSHSQIPRKIHASFTLHCPKNAIFTHKFSHLEVTHKSELRIIRSAEEETQVPEAEPEAAAAEEEEAAVEEAVAVPVSPSDRLIMFFQADYVTPPPPPPPAALETYKPPSHTKPQAPSPPAKSYTPPPLASAPPVKPYLPSPKSPSPPVIKRPSPLPYYGRGPLVKKQECLPLCKKRCALHSRMSVCIRACSTCCYRCKCVPPGTYGNKEVCGRCYTDMTTHGGRPKCP